MITPNSRNQFKLTIGAHAKKKNAVNLVDGIFASVAAPTRNA
jgi:hypothetical protein